MSSHHSQRFSFFKAIPNLAVFLLLAGVIYAGHISGWKIPKFSELTGSKVTEKSLWCGDHLVPEAECVECLPDLIPKEQDFGFCKDHGVFQCVTDNPALAQVGGGVNLPKYDTVKAVHLIARTENSNRDELHKKRVQFATKDAVFKAGVGVDVVGEGAITETINANGEVTFNPYQVATLASKSSGTVAAVLKQIGDKVQTGELLALIDAQQVGQLKSQLLKDMVQLRWKKDNLQRVRALAQTKAASQQELIQADAEHQQAAAALISTKQFLASLGFTLPEIDDTDDPSKLSLQLQYLGIPDEIVKQLPPTAKNNNNLLPVISPFDGVVTQTDVVLGTVVDTAKILLTVADPQKMWIMLNVRQEDAPYIHLGQSVHFVSDNGDQRASGTISWICPSVDEKTRTLRIRAEVLNPDGTLRDHIFGEGRITLRQESNAVLVPQEAIQATADSQYVFVRDKNFFAEERPKIFYVRQVRLGAKGSGQNADKVEILAGVLPGEVIVTKGSNVLLAHLLRSNLGAGCCAEH